MNADRYQFLAFIATLAAPGFVFDSALVAAAISPGIMGKLEVFGLGTITGGLISALKAPMRSTSASDATVSAALNKVPDAPAPHPHRQPRSSSRVRSLRPRRTRSYTGSRR